MLGFFYGFISFFGLYLHSTRIKLLNFQLFYPCLMKALGNRQAVYLKVFFKCICFRCPVLFHILPYMIPCGDSNFLRKDQIVIPGSKRNINLKMVTISYFTSSTYLLYAGKKNVLSRILLFSRFDFKCSSLLKQTAFLGFGEIRFCHPKELLLHCNWIVTFKIYVQVSQISKP